MELDLEDDLAKFDHLEPVRVTIGAETFDVSALRRPLTPSVDGGVARRANWHVEVGDLTTDPVAGCTIDTLTPGVSETWTVEAAERMTFGTRWKLQCVL